MATQNLLAANELEARRLWFILGWALVLFVIYQSLTPAPIAMPLEHGDKFSHVLAYLVLMSWFANLHAEEARRVRFAIGFIALGVALEFAQRWTGLRSFELSDMAANATGVAVGWMLAPPRMPNYLRFMEELCRSWSASKN